MPKDRYSSDAAAASELAATASEESASAETSLQCAQHAETWAANETSKLLKAVEEAGSSAAERVTENSAAESRYAEIHGMASDVRVHAGGGNVLATVAEAAEDAILTAASGLYTKSAELTVSFHQVDVLKSSSSRAAERSTLAS